MTPTFNSIKERKVTQPESTTIQPIPVHPNFIDITAHTYGFLVVLGYAGKAGDRHRWICRCACGNLSIVNAGCLRSGNTKSCGRFKHRTPERTNPRPCQSIGCEKWYEPNRKGGGARGYCHKHYTQIFCREIVQCIDCYKIENIRRGHGRKSGRCPKCSKKEVSSRPEVKAAQRRNGLRRGAVPNGHRFTSENTSGPKNPAWKGGVSSLRARDMATAQYRAWRKSVYERDNYTCQFCGQRGGKLEADHIKPYSTHVELRYELFNGRTLCKPCHATTDSYGGKSRKNTRKSLLSRAPF